MCLVYDRRAQTLTGGSPTLRSCLPNETSALNLFCFFCQYHENIDMLSILRYTQKKKKFFLFLLFASHDIDRQLLTIQCLIDVITQDAYQIKSPYTEEDDALTWGRVCVLVGRLLISGIRAAKRSVTFTASAASTREEEENEEEKEDEEDEEEEEEEEFGTSVKGQQQPRSAASATPNNVIFHCKFRDDRTSSLVENCIVAIHALASLPYVPLSMDSPTMKLMLISFLGRARGSLSNPVQIYILQTTRNWKKIFYNLSTFVAVLIHSRCFSLYNDVLSTCNSFLPDGVINCWTPTL